MGPSRRVVAISSVALATFISLALAESGGAQDADCNDEIGSLSARLRSSYRGQLARCMKFGNFADCETAGFHVVEAQNDVRASIINPNGPCAQALVGGAAFADLGPGDTCPAAGARCDQRIPSISSLEDLAECIVCMQEGFDASYRLGLDLPAAMPAIANERKCVRSVTVRSMKAVRSGIREAQRCAAHGVKPFSCPVLDDPATKFGKDLMRVADSVANCKDAAGQSGALSGDSALLCHHTARAPADLARCAQATARCLVCSHANGVYDQAQDCVAFSGLPCRGNTSTAGSMYAASMGADTVTYYTSARVPLNGTLAASSFATGDAPAALAANPELDVLYVANSGDGTVTFLDASSGDPLYGTLVNSTFDAGADPEALTVDTEADLLFVANRSADTVSLLNALDGRPYYGPGPPSVVTVGDEPRALSHSETFGVVYVANFAADSLTLLDRDTGAYLYGTLAGSTVPTGDGPVALTDADASVSPWNVVHVLNYVGDTVSFLDAVTGLPALGTLAESSVAVGTGPRAAAVGSGYFGQGLLHVASDDGTMTILKAGTGAYVQAVRPNATFPIDAAPSAASYDRVTSTLYVSHANDDFVAAFDPLADIDPSTFEIGSACSSFAMDLAVDEPHNRVYASCDDRIVVFDATTGAYAFGSQVSSTFLVDEWPRSLALDTSSQTLYVAGLDVHAIPDGLDGTAYRDALTGAALPGSPVLTGNLTWDVAVNPVLGTIYVAGHDTGTLRILNATTPAVLSTSEVGVYDGLAVNATAGILYAVGHTSSIVRYLDAIDGSPLFGTLASSTFAVGSQASDIALNAAANMIYVANDDDETVTFLDATTGAYAFGTFAGSTFPAVASGRVAVAPTASRLYVGDSGSGFHPAARQVTILDAQTGAPANGTMLNSALDRIGVGAVAVNVSASRLYALANGFGTGGGVTYYDLSTGAFLNTSLPVTSLPAGDGPSAVVVMD